MITSSSKTSTRLDDGSSFFECVTEGFDCDKVAAPNFDYSEAYVV